MMEDWTIGLLSVAAAAAGLWTWSLYNDLSRQREQLKALSADVRCARGRRRAIERAGGHYGRQSSRHVERTTRQAGRGKRGGREMKFNADGWPEARGTQTFGDAMAADLAAQQDEQHQRRGLHQAAAEYNARLRGFPACLIAEALGFRPWEVAAVGGNPRQRSRPFSNRRRRNG